LLKVRLSHCSRAMFEALKKTGLPTSLKRKAGALATPTPTKKSKSKSNSSAIGRDKGMKALDSPQSSSDPGAEGINFEANVVSSSYRPKPDEVLKSFDNLADKASLASQAEDFFKNKSMVCIKNGHDWDALSRYRNAVCRSIRKG
jgi:hypothetical protein